MGKRPNGKTEYRASGPLIFEDDDGARYTVPTGWRSDGVSWPTWLRFAILAIGAAAVALWALGAPVWVFAPAGAWFALSAAFWLLKPKALVPAFLHDWLCQQQLAFPDKRRADAIFYRAMRARGVSVLYRWPMYQWVKRRNQRVDWQQPEFQPIVVDGYIIGWE
ncbi:hypothetical protein WP12_19315 [Sphingomonas sp. SRS2]|nr:hypothetical protein WP12_19315 [Sphingomonas sp. SRS2]